MKVMWSATSPEIGKSFSAVLRSSFEELEDRFIALRTLGEGYVEIEVLAEESPQVALSFRGDHAVVHLLDDVNEEPKSFLLVGDGSLAPDGEAGMPVMDDSAVFSGDFVMRVDRAWDAVRNFVRTGSAAGLGEWHEL